jgi:hypothetical protein
MVTAVRISNLKADLSSCFYSNTRTVFIRSAIQRCGDGDGGGGGGGDTVNRTATVFGELNFKNLYGRFGKS